MARQGRMRPPHSRPQRQALAQPVTRRSRHPCKHLLQRCNEHPCKCRHPPKSARSRDVCQLGRQPALRVRLGAQVEVPLSNQGAVQAVVAAPVEAVDGAIGCAVDAAPAAHIGHRLVPAHDGVGVAERLPIGNRVALGQEGLADACGGGVGGGAAEAWLRHERRMAHRFKLATCWPHVAANCTSAQGEHACW